VEAMLMMPEVYIEMLRKKLTPVLVPQKSFNRALIEPY
jgi:hypothetical protein